MFSVTQESLRFVQRVWGVPSSVDMRTSTAGLYCLLVDRRDSFDRNLASVEALWRQSASADPFDPLMTHKKFVREFMGLLAGGESFHCGIWKMPHGFQAICPHKRVAALGSILIDAFQAGTPSPLAPLEAQYPGFLQAQQGLIHFLSDVDSVYGDFASIVWERMNASITFQDPEAQIRRLCDQSRFDSMDWA
ncbi:MAG: hypothetical protein IPJ69_00685 [Deltaproteobacteria bacterium]|nr:MAG: hypothetical protein IPJ69_00685 [Deltaproteobacteria bacterium]